MSAMGPPAVGRTHGHKVEEKARVEFHLENRGLTVEATPAGDVAGLVVWKDEVSSRETSSHDGIREGDGRLQLDQGDVVAAEDTGVTLNFGLFIQDSALFTE